MLIKTSLILLIVSVLAYTGYTAPALTPCPRAPLSRVHAGAALVVAPGIDVLNLRALPARTTGVQARLSPGTALTVIGGASCNGGYNWWRVELADGTRGWVAEGTWEAYWLNPADDPDRVVDPVEWTCGGSLRSRRCISP